jgi:hypothetical protein
MKKHKDGGPAFPGFDHIDQNGRPNPPGMSLRDYFAAAALSGLLSNKEGYDRGYAFASEEAYHYADEMLIARKQYP